MRRVYETIVAVEKEYVLHIGGWVDVTAWTLAYAFACVTLLTQHTTRMRRIVCGIWLHLIFSHYLINGAIFEKTLLSIKCVF